MKDKIKEINITFPGKILDYVDTKEHLLELFNYITNLQIIEQQYSAILSENAELENKITNLQEKLKVSQTNEETYRLEMQDITKILGLDEHTTFDEVKEYATNLQEENRILKNKLNIDLEWAKKCDDLFIERNNYKSRNGKAIEYIKSLCYIESKNEWFAYGDDLSPEHIVNILQGEDKE